MRQHFVRPSKKSESCGCGHTWESHDKNGCRVRVVKQGTAGPKSVLTKCSCEKTKE